MSHTSINIQNAARLAATVLGAWALLSAPAQAGTNVGVSVSVAQPGFYGRVDIGDQPPALLYPQPVIIEQRPIAIQQRPIYLRVPPGHSRDWAHHCGYYRACGQPVYFVRDEPRRDYDRRDRHDHDDRRGGRDDQHGRGHDQGRGHGHGHDRD